MIVAWNQLPLDEYVDNDDRRRHDNQVGRRRHDEHVDRRRHDENVDRRRHDDHES